jgi:site-specific recombinase XerD
MFFRYLAIRGYCSPDLVGVIPTIAHRRLASLPRHISEGDVERVIAACDPGTQRGLRNRAVLLLLARLGLRAGDVASLRLTDLDWKRGRIRLMGKARREVWLPLPQEAGDAILCYIDRGRPELDVERVFLTLRAPVRPLSPTGVSHAVRRAIRRAGVEAPVTGARILRHSFATALLRRGATLDAIGSILRHQNTETTAVYSKVNSTLLLDVAQPWPGKAVVHAE